MNKTINIAIAGVGNCASSLLQGIEYYRNRDESSSIGLMHRDLGGYTPGDIRVVAAFDIDYRKVGLDVNKAIFSRPNCTKVFHPDMPETGVIVKKGPVLDGYPEHFDAYFDDDVFRIEPAQKELSKEGVVRELEHCGADMLLNYLPVGSEKATKFYAECALEAGLGFVNNIPVFIASNEMWTEKFAKAKLPLIGDDIKSQLGATITHRTLTDLFRKRGVRLERTYQLNTGGNTDFLNMLDRSRLKSKKISKTEAVQAVTATRLDSRDIHIGPSDYVPWQNDQKICFIRMEGRLFGDVPMNLELRLSVEDSPNSAGVAIDSIRCCRIALDRGIGGVLYSPASYFCKHPPVQYTDDEAFTMVEEFITGKRNA